MASSILIPLKAVFDNKGIRDAQSQFGKLGNTLKGTLGAVGLGIGLAAVTSGLKDAAKAASDDAKSQLLLAQQMKNSTGATDEQILATEDMIGKLSIMSAVADDQLRPALASLVRATGDVSQAQALLALSLDVSAATGKDLNSVSLAIGKAVTGQTQALFRMIPGLKGSSDWMAKLQKETAGAAQTAGDADPFMRLTIIFDEIQEQIGSALLPAMKELAAWLSSDVGQAEIAKLVDAFKGLAMFVGQVILWLKDNYKMLLKVAGLAALILGLSAAFSAVTTAIKLATAAQILFAAVSAATPWGLIALAIGAIAGAWVLAADAANGYANASADATDTGANAGSFTPTNKKGGALTLDEYNKTTGKIKPKTKPADPFADLKKQLDNLKKTTDTVKNADTKAADAAKKAAAARAKAIADAKQLADKAKQAFDDLKKSIADFNDSFAKTATAFRDVFRFSAPLGEFEQQAVDAFQSIKDSAQEAFDQGLIPASALKNLKAYADREQVLLQGIAKQRDQLAKKISIAQAVTSGVMGSLDINSMLQSETKQVTRSVTSMVNGIALTTTQTFDEVVTSGLADSFKKLVDKTKTFASNLIKLKALGLNGQLFKQIVDAGATTGGATAEAIIAGGADAVKELNGLFGQLTEAGASIAETATPVMYALGEDMTNSFIDGLRSQDQVLIAQASAMAALFTSSFQTQLSSSMAPTITASANLAGMGIDQTDFIRGYGRVTGYGTAPGGGAVTNNITVNAGVVANKQELPAIIVDALNTAAKQGLSTRIINAI